MELFGTKFTLSLGTWRLRFVLMLEDDQQSMQTAATTQRPHHIAIVRDHQGVR